MPTISTRLKRLELTVGFSPDGIEPEPRVAGKTRAQAIAEYIAWMRRTEHQRNLATEKRVEYAAEIRDLEARLARELEDERLISLAQSSAVL